MIQVSLPPPRHHDGTEGGFDDVVVCVFQPNSNRFEMNILRRHTAAPTTTVINSNALWLITRLATLLCECLSVFVSACMCVE